MLRVDCYDFYSLGMRVHRLTDLQGGGLISSEWVTLYEARNELNTFFGTYPLKTVRNPANTLYRAINEVIPLDLLELRFKDDDGVDIKLTPYNANVIRTAAVEFESVIKAELVGWDAYYVSQKGAFSTTELIQQAEVLITEPGRSFLGDEAVADLRQAGMCIAFNLGTAACFHVTRATESVMRDYYKELIGTLPAVKQRNWGAFHRTLSKCQDADSKVLSWLKHITDDYRNPVLHPDEMLDIDSAIDFITACAALISAMARAMVKRGVKSYAERKAELRSSNDEGTLSLQSGDAAPS